MVFSTEFKALVATARPVVGDSRTPETSVVRWQDGAAGPELAVEVSRTLLQHVEERWNLKIVNMAIFMRLTGE